MTTARSNSKSNKPVPKKPKAPKKTAVKSATKETALATQKPATITPIKQDEPETAAWSDSFKSQATKLDTKIRSTIQRMERDAVTLGEMCLEMKDKGYFAALGYKTSADYFNAVLPAGMGKTQAFQAMKIVRELTSGENPAVSKEDVRAMPKQNADGLASLHARGVTITPELTAQAKEMPIKRFQDEIVLPNAPDLAQRKAAQEGKTIASSPQVMISEKTEWPSDLYAEKEATLQIAMWMARDDDRTTPLREKAWQLIFAEFRNTYEAEYNAGKANEAAEEQHNARVTEANMGPLDHTEDEVEEEVLDDEEVEDDKPVNNVIPDEIPEEIVEVTSDDDEDEFAFEPGDNDEVIEGERVVVLDEEISGE